MELFSPAWRPVADNQDDPFAGVPSRGTRAAPSGFKVVVEAPEFGRQAAFITELISPTGRVSGPAEDAE